MGNSGRKGGRPLGRRRTGCAGGAGLSGAGPVCCRKMNIKTGISILEIPVFCLQKMGVEPTRYYYHTDLNREGHTECERADSGELFPLRTGPWIWENA